MPRPIVAALLCAVVPLPVSAATVSVAGATFKVRPEQPPLAARAVSMSAARNEFEAFQILVSGPATGVTATATALVNGATSIGPVRLYREELIRIVNLSAPDAIVPAGGFLPDALVPDVDEIDGQRRGGFVGFDVPAGVTRAIWGEVHVPESAPAGTYTGAVTVRFAEGSAVVPVSLTVYDFALPSEPSLRSAFGLTYGQLPSGHGISTAGDTFPSLRAKYARMALDHRITLSSHDDGDLSIPHFDAFYGLYVAGEGATQLAGAALANVQYMGSATDTAAMRAWFDHFAAREWGNRVFQYTCDEPPMTCAWTDIPARLRAAKTASPGYRTLLTTTLQEAEDAEARHGIRILPDLEILVPVVNFLDGRPGSRFAGPQWTRYLPFLASGPLKELWTYQSCMSHGCGGAGPSDTGWPSYMIDASAVRNRAMQWIAFRSHASGELYYETAMAYRHDAWNDQWDFTGNGDGTLFYPGTPGRIGGTSHVPVASIRLKLLREGMEDFEYLKALSDLGDRATADAEAAALFPSAWQTEADPAALMAARDRIARRIVALRSGAPPLGYDAPVVPDVAIDGDLADLAAPPVALSGAAAGSDGTAEVRIAYDLDHLYVGWSVKDGAIVVNERGRDGEVWNGDGVEVLIDVANGKHGTLDPSHFHVLVNAEGDVTDERGVDGRWDRSWSSGATRAVVRTAAGYDVELRVPWSSMGVDPCAGRVLGLDFAVNDVDAAWAAPRPFDWAGLTRFAQPDRWGTLTLTSAVAGDVYVVHQAAGPVAIDGDLREWTRAPAVRLDAAAAAAGSDNQLAARLLHDASNLYAAFEVRDGTLLVNQGGRDGEVWNGDGVELLLDPRADRTTSLSSDDRHVLVNANGELTDESGTSYGWSRSWTSWAAHRVARVAGGYVVELAVPWSALGVAPPAGGAVMGLDLANNDTDVAGLVKQFDWAGLTRFAQPSRWKRARFEARPPACTGSAAPAPGW